MTGTLASESPHDDAADELAGEREPRTRMRGGGRSSLRWSKIGPVVLVAFPVLFNLVVLAHERLVVSWANDTSLHAAMVRWAERRISTGHMPFDGWFPSLSTGGPQFHEYQSLPHVITGLFSAVTGVSADSSTAWAVYLLLALWPLCLYWSARIFGFDRMTSGAIALLSPLVRSVPGYGYDYGAYIWRGWGMWSQLWGMWGLPLALALSWRALTKGKGYAWAALALAFTMACHFMTGYLAMLALGVFVFVSPRVILVRLRRAAVIGVGSVLVASWVLVPLLADRKYFPGPEFLGGFYTRSWGLPKVLSWLVRGELLDWSHWPALSILAGIGVVYGVVHFRRDERIRALIAFAVLSLVLFSGPKTFGFLTVLPGGSTIFFHRYVIGVNLVGLFLAGVGLTWSASLVRRAITSYVDRRGPDVRAVRGVAAVVSVAAVIAIVAVLYPGWKERAQYAHQSAVWIDAQRDVDRTYVKDVVALADEAAARGDGRIWAGMTNGWGNRYHLGAVRVYGILENQDFDAIGNTLRIPTLMVNVEPHFKERNPADYELFGIKYLILPRTREPAVPATKIDERGFHVLWAVDSSGYLDVVDTVEPPIRADAGDIGKRSKFFLDSALLRDKKYPTVAFDGADAAPATAGNGDSVDGAAGSVASQFQDLDNGTYGGVVDAKRRAVVLLKASYTPRWKVTVDGKPAATQMVAPAFVGVAVPPGRHRIVFQYQPFQYYGWLFLLGAVTLVALAAGPTLWAQRRGRRDEHADAGWAPPSRDH